MEAVPRLPMLSCELKHSPSNTEFGPALKKYIQEFYHEDPESYNKEIKELESLRQSACKVPRDFTGCRILKRYFSQLQSLQSRFPMSEDGVASVPFMWSDIYSGITFNITDVRYEQACVLYNIGALHSELGANDSRSNAEGMKVSCTHFQCAAWAFQHLRETYPQPKGSDMSHDLLTFFITLMLAQAQECILEKSMLDSRKSTITAKLAAQVVDYYKSALATLVSGSASVESGCILDIVGSKNFKNWKKFLEFKMLYYGSLSHLYMGNQAEEQQQMGERLAWYQSAIDKHGEAIKLAKTMDRDDITDALNFTLDVIGGKYNAAKKENDFVYHEKVQAPETLPDIKGASLVKGIPFSISDPDISGTDIFVRLVPMEAHEASSVYSEEKAKLLREIAAKIENKDQELVTYLTSLKLDRSLLMPKEEKIPQELLEKCAALSVRTNVVQDLSSALNALTEVFEEVNSSLRAAQELIMREEEGERLHQETFEKRVPSLIILELNKELAKYQEAHKRASDSNSTLQKAMSMHVANLQLLSGSLDDLQKSLPSINLMDTPNDESIGKEILQLLDKVEEMRKQRTMLESQLRDAIQNDDITKRLVTRDKKDTLEKLFEEELKKHDTLVGYLDQNLSAQDNILRALTQANARFADTRKAIAEVMERRELKVASLLNSYAAYEDLIAKAQKGLEFYEKLQTNVSKLLARVRSVTSVQEEERQQIVQAHARKMGKKQLTPVIGDGPKLKDYLPYMSPGVKGIPDIHGAPSTTPLSQNNDGPKLKDFWSYTGPSSQKNIPPTPILNSTTPLPATSSWKSDHFPISSAADSSILSSATIASMGVRPAPVGSEHTGTTTNCMSTSQVNNTKNVCDSDQWHYTHSTNNYASYLQNQQPVETPRQPVVSQSNYIIPQHQMYGTPYVPPTALEGMSSQSTYSANKTSYSSMSTNYSTVSSPTTFTTKSETYSANQLGSYYQHNDSYRKYTFSQQPSDWATASVYTCRDNSIVSSVQEMQPSQSMSSNVTPVSYSVQPLSTNQLPQQSVDYQVPSHPVYTSTASQWSSQYQQPPVLSTSETSAPSARSSSVPGSQQWTGQMQWGGNTSNAVQQFPGQAQSSYGTGTQWSGQAPDSSRWTNSVNPIQSQQWSNQTHQAQLPPSTPYAPNTVGTNWTGQMQQVSSASSYLPGVTQPSLGTSKAWATQQTQDLLSANAQWTDQAQQFSARTPVTYDTNVPWTGHVQQLPSNAPVGPIQQTATMQWPDQTQQVPPTQPTQWVGPTIVAASVLQPETGFSKTDVTTSNVSPASVVSPDVISGGMPLKPVQASELSQPSSTSSSPSHAVSHANKESKDLLSKMPDGTQESPVLQPMVTSLSELNLNKDEKEVKDPLSDSATLQRFVADVEKFEKFVEGLTRKTLNGPTPLDQKWKEITDAQDKETRKLSISVARCYPLKNRFPDIMPYDNNRVAINTARNDYINASFLKDILPKCPNFIVTQAPLSSTLADFWIMVWEQQVEIIVCLLSTAELKGLFYWPQERGQQMTFGPLTVSIQSTKCKQFFTEYMINVTHSETRTSRVVVHLQFSVWSSSAVPDSPSQLLQFIQEFHGYNKQQRNLQKPAVVHCSGGVGRSGVFCLLSAAIKEMRCGNSPPELSHLASRMSQQRKFLLQEKEQLKFSYDAALYYAQDILMKRGILTNKASTFAPSSGTHTRHPSEDFILGGSLKLENVKSEGDTESPESTIPRETTLCANNLKTVAANAEQSTESLLGHISTQDTDKLSKEAPSSENQTANHNSSLSIASLLDPATFTLDPVDSPGKRRITKDSFKNPPGLMQSSNDPLSLLDPMWSLKKSKD